MTRTSVGLALTLALPTLGLAQETPETQAWREHLLRAQDSCEGAYDALVQIPLDLEGAGQYELAQVRAEARFHLGQAKAAERPAFAPTEARAFLEQARQALRERLLELEPVGAALEQEDVTPPLELRIHDVRDLADYGEQDVPAPTLGLSWFHDGGGARSAGGVLSFCEDYDRDASSACVGADMLIELLEEALDASDRVEYEEGALEYASGRLFVRKTAGAQRVVAETLDQLRRQRAGKLELDVRAYAVPTALLARLRDAAADGLDAGEEALLAEAKLLAQQEVLADDGRRVSIERMQTSNYQGDLEVNQTGVVPVLNPVIMQLREGLAIELRPLVERRARRVLIDVRAAFAERDGPPERRLVRDHELEFPRTRVTQIRGLAVTPLGRAAVVGGTLASTDADGQRLDVVLVIRPRLVQGGAQ